MHPECSILIKKSESEMARAGAELFVGAARDSIAQVGALRAALSGGSTPRSMYGILVQGPFARRVPWEKTYLFWVDERCVPEDDEASNYGAAKRDFIDRVPIPKDHVYPMPTHIPPEQGARRYEAILRESVPLSERGIPCFDLIFLGVGKDGHTASLFPGHPALEEEERLVARAKGGDPDVERLTLTLPVINAARRIIFMVAGKEKASILREIFEGSGGDLAAQRVAPRRGQLIWLLDEGAAELIPKEALHGQEG